MPTNPPVKPPTRNNTPPHVDYGRVHNEARLAGQPTLIHVDKHRIRKGEPAVIVRTPSGYIRCCSADITGPTSVGQWRDEAFPDGPNSWVETRSQVTPHGIVESGNNPPTLDVTWLNVASKRADR